MRNSDTEKRETGDRWAKRVDGVGEKRPLEEKSCVAAPWVGGWRGWRKGHGRRNVLWLMRSVLLVLNRLHVGTKLLLAMCQLW